MENEVSLLLKFIVAHTMLFTFFYVSNIYTLEVKPNLSGLAQNVLGLAYVFSLLAASLFWKVFTLKRADTHAYPSSPQSRKSFLFSVSRYYLILLGTPTLAILLDGALPLYVLQYIAFVYLLWIVGNADYCIPLYNRYIRLFYDGNWNRRSRF